MGITVPLRQHSSEPAIHPSPSSIHSPRNQLRLVFWETTSGCNLECIHCRRLDVAAELAKQDMTTEQGMAFIDSWLPLPNLFWFSAGGSLFFAKIFFPWQAMLKAKV